MSQRQHRRRGKRMQAERHSSFGGGVDRQSSRIGRGQVRLGWLLRYAFAVVCGCRGSAGVAR